MFLCTSNTLMHKYITGYTWLVAIFMLYKYIVVISPLNITILYCMLSFFMTHTWASECSYCTHAGVLVIIATETQLGRWKRPAPVAIWPGQTRPEK